MGTPTRGARLVEELRALDLDARRTHAADALAADPSALRGQDPLELAELLGVPAPTHPGAGWSMTEPPPFERLEEQGIDGRVFEALWPLVDEAWPADRRALLRREFERCDEEGRADLGFLNRTERDALTRALARRCAGALQRAGLGVIAEYTVEVTGGRGLVFDCGLDPEGRAVDLNGPRLTGRGD